MSSLLGKKEYMLGDHRYLICSIIISCALVGCGADVEMNGPSSEGEYSLCSYSDEMYSGYYASAKISYPCGRESQPHAAIVLTGGFLDKKETMYWLSDHLTHYGFTVITITPTTIIGPPVTWRDSHIGGYNKLLEENNNPSSPIYMTINTDAISLVGYSFGAAGALMAANELGSQITSLVLLAPVYPPGFDDLDIENVTATSLIVGGTNDILSTPKVIESLQKRLQNNAPSSFVIFNNVFHESFISIGSYHNLMKSYIVPHLEYYLESNSRYLSYLGGRDHDEFVESERIYDSIFNL